MSVSTPSDAIVRAAKLLKLMGNPERLAVLIHLSNNGETGAGALEEITGLSQSALSQQLKKLRRGGMVKTRRDGVCIYYSLAGECGSQSVTTIEKIYQFCELGAEPTQRVA